MNAASRPPPACLNAPAPAVPGPPRPQVALGWDEGSRLLAAAGGGGGGEAKRLPGGGGAEEAPAGSGMGGRTGWEGAFWLHGTVQVRRLGVAGLHLCMFC